MFLYNETVFMWWEIRLILLDWKYKILLSFMSGSGLDFSDDYNF